MGQRHQAFVIAKVVPHGQTQARYRCIAALHHQWCYGRLPLKATRRFLSVVKQKDNAEIIHEELRLIQGKYARWGEQPEKPKIPNVPCPYTAFLLGTSWNLDFENKNDPYSSGGALNNALLPANMGSSDGDNNDGITVIDITDPEHPAYCFVSVGGLEAEEAVEDYVPLSATDYARAYYPIPGAKEMADEKIRLTEESVSQTIASLDGEPLVTLEMLADAWADEYRGTLEASKKSESNEGKDVLSVPVIDNASNTLIPSLADLALTPAINHALEQGQTVDIEDLVWLPGKAEAIFADLRARRPFPAPGMALLSKALKQLSDAHIVDLSNFHLTTEQIISVLGAFENVEVVNLSHNPLVTVDTVRAVLTSIPKLKRLVILDTSISTEDLSSFLTTDEKLFLHLDALIHPLLVFGKGASYPNAFSFVGLVPDMRTAAAASLAFFTPALVVQALTDYLAGFLSEYPFAATGTIQATLAPQAVFSSGLRGEGQKWSNRSVPRVPQASLRAFKGEGWLFALQWPAYDHGPGQKLYGFIKVNPAVTHSKGEKVDTKSEVEEPEPEHKVLDLKSFLSEMEGEGRPPASAAAVDELVNILDRLGKEKDLGLMGPKEARAFVGMLRPSP
ncbi:hypothetical protein Hypma_010968 [Hypsizygus marmoreus]|uniref:Uncharacterized protein n=1 Tax=Hypsizygus marmoreus TaxID=39966 RepID=A0A369JJ82_HYPMA|nr:hypothetical protein Hypma_010968 [Hypsizygus marmoreus]